MDFSIILASRSRPILLSNLLNSISKTTKDISRIEVLIGIDNDDQDYKFLSQILEKAYSFCKFYSRDRSNMLNRDYLNWLARDYSKGKYLIICNDDVEFRTQNWDDIVDRKLASYFSDKIDRLGYVFFSDGIKNRNGMGYGCFPLITREVHSVLGFAMPPEFGSWNADICLWRCFAALNRICDCSEVMLYHVSYHSGSRDKDEINNHVARIAGGTNTNPSSYINKLNKALGGVMKRKISIILPGIRVERWHDLVYSVDVHQEWEVVICSPYDLPDNLKDCDRVFHVKDYGNPVRSSCKAVELAKGEYITWAADDGVFCHECLDKCIKVLDDNKENEKKIVTAKYYEGGDDVHGDDYYKLSKAYPKTPYIDDNWWIMNVGVMHRKYYQMLGGWDCQFETTAVSHADLAVRCQRDGASVELIQTPMLRCTHMPNDSGDHAPIYHAHNEHDEPLYRQIYNNPDCINRIKIDINNWKNAPEKWIRRFPK